jgi:hypothetical protein
MTDTMEESQYSSTLAVEMWAIGMLLYRQCGPVQKRSLLAMPEQAAAYPHGASQRWATWQTDFATAASGEKAQDYRCP